MAKQDRAGEHGPFRADQLRDGDRYELSDGHPIYCAPAGRDHAGRNLTGAAVVESDPDVEWAGVDAGFSPDPGTLRAPDIAVAPRGDERGWIKGVPPLAVEYAGPGQDTQEMETKISELLAHGTRLVWIVHLVGPHRVEVRRPDAPTEVLGPGDSLQAPGILRNPVPVEALYDRKAGHEAVLRNLLQRAGYEGIDAIRDEGVEQGIEQGIAGSILALLADRGIEVDPATRDRILGCRDRDTLRRWLLAASRAERVGDVFGSA